MQAINAIRMGGVEVLHGIELSLPAGRWTSVVGPNGAGKSTLLKALAGLLPHSGTVNLLGRPLVVADPLLEGGTGRWTCENCSDPDCERRLFSGLVNSRSR